MAQDKSDNFLRPIPQRNNEKLRENLSAPDILNSANPSFPVEGIASSNRQPQKTPVNRGEITRRDDDDIKDMSIGLQDHDESIAYYFDKWMTLDSNKKLHFSLFFLGIISMFLAGTRNNMIIAIFLPAILFWSYSRNKVFITSIYFCLFLSILFLFKDSIISLFEYEVFIDN